MISGIHISPSDIILKKEIAKNAVFSSLKTNQKVEAEVLKVFSGKKALILIAGKKVMIATPFPLTEGEKLLVNLLETETNRNLKLWSLNDNKISEKLISLIKLVSQSNPFESLSKIEDKELSGMLKSISLNSARADIDFVPRLLEKSGLLFEKKLSVLLTQDKDAGLKPEVLQIIKDDIKGYVLDHIQSPKNQDMESLKAFNKFSSGIESFQAFNTQSADVGKYLIPFPVFVNDSFSFGQLLIDLGNKEKDNNKKKDRIVNVSFLLNMSRLGPLRADFSVYKKAISGVFNLSNKEIYEFVKTMVPELKQRFLKREYIVHNIECKLASKEMVSPDSIFESFIKDENRVLNIII